MLLPSLFASDEVREPARTVEAGKAWLGMGWKEYNFT